MPQHLLVFAEFEDRSMDLLGGPRGMEEMVYRQFENQRAMRLFASLVLNVRSLYVMGVERIARSMVSVITARLDPLKDGGLCFEIGIPGDLRGCAAYHHGSTGLLRLMPTYLGLPPASVHAEIEPRRAVFLISPPPSQDVATRVRRSFEALRRDEGRCLEMENFSASLLDDSLVVEEGRKAAQGLLAARTLDELAETLSHWLRATSAAEVRRNAGCDSSAT
jgi:hypothetical protein